MGAGGNCSGRAMQYDRKSLIGATLTDDDEL